MNMRSLPAILAIALACLAQPIHPQSPQPDESSDPARVIFPPGILPPLPPPRIDLRVPDVGPMQTREMTVFARVDGLHAVVETTILFHNPNARELEGELVFPLPDGAAVCGYALDINGALVDGVVVPKDRARVAFETETRRQVDPGLVEHVQGNLHRTRVYPLPAQGGRRIRLTYTTPLATAPNGDAALFLPLPREAIAKLTVKIEVAAPEGVTPQVGGLGDKRFEMAARIWRVESSSENSTPGEDILVAMPKLPASFHRIETDPDGATRFMITTVAPPAKPRPAEPGLVQVLWDASGSRAGADLSREFALLAESKARAFRLIIFRDAPETARDFTSADELIAAIKAEPFDGGTDLAALAASLRAAPAPQDPAHTLLFTDGLDTLSGQTLEFAGRTPVAIVSQTIANREALRQACAGALIDLQTTDAASAWSEIESPASRITGVDGTGIAGVQGVGRPALGRVSLLGRLTAPEATVRIVYADGSTSDPFVLRQSEAAAGRVLATAWAAARVGQLAPRAGDFEDELLALGRGFGLVSPATSLIVLESLDQWLRHEIEPPASLPEMRRQWREAMKGRPDANTPDDSQRLEQVAALWQQRVEWWKTDFSKARPAPGQRRGLLGRLFGGGGEPRADIDQAFAMPAAPPAPANGHEEGAADAFAPAAEITGGLRSGDAAVSRNSIDALLNRSAGALDGRESPADATIEVKPWSPDTPYLKSIRAAKPDGRYAAYLAERKNWSQSPAFFLDCAEVFYQNKDQALARRILSNLAELRIEDAPCSAFSPRACARPANSTSPPSSCAASPSSARRNHNRSATSPWCSPSAAAPPCQRPMSRRPCKPTCASPSAPGTATATRSPSSRLRNSTPWSPGAAARTGPPPANPSFPITTNACATTSTPTSASSSPGMPTPPTSTSTSANPAARRPSTATTAPPAAAWSRRTSPTVTARRNTSSASRPPANTRSAPIISARTSRQSPARPPSPPPSSPIGAAPTNNVQTLTLRLDKPKDKVEVGAVTFGRADLPTEAANLSPGLTRDQVIAILGKPADAMANPLAYPAGPRSVLIHFDNNNTLLRVTEVLPGGGETILVQ
jgi:Ca-activated chloride channel homolog